MRRSTDSRLVSWIIRIIVIAALIAAIYFLFFNNGKQRDIAGVPDPIQAEAEGHVDMEIDDYQIGIDYLMSYDISALVVGTENYSWGGIGDELAPRDLALAWGKVAEFNTKVGFDWSQSGRWYRWKADSYDALIPVGDVSYVNTHSSNNHLIPADDIIRKKIKKIKIGDYIHINGYLVSLNGHDDKGNTIEWKSSISREDSGAHSCELIYVTDLDWISH